MKPEQIYTETKYLLFTIIKALPTLSDKAENDIKALLAEASKYASENNDFQLDDKVKKIHHNCKKLVSEGMLNESDNYAKLRKDTVQVSCLQMFNLIL